MAGSQLISCNVDVSPNEYVTKYSINRNFLKLTENDKILSSKIQQTYEKNKVYSYVRGRIYGQGDCVFYKVSPESQSMYLLSSLVGDNVQSPSLSVNAAGDRIVVSDEYWQICGTSSKVATDVSPVDAALEYIKSNANVFLSAHQNNTDFSAHPTGKLGLDQSTVLFSAFDNIQESRDRFFYPNQLRSLNPDGTIIGGYCRQWDNGLLEYDVQFRIGSAGAYDAETGLPVISANNLKVIHRNQNNFYFEDQDDFKIFNQDNKYSAILNDVKQVNLNTHTNAFYGEIRFPVEFKDLNYSVFTSNVKCFDTEAQNVNNDILTSNYFDARLIYDGLAIVGHAENGNYQKPILVPNEVRNIGYFALADIEEVNGIELEIAIDKDRSDLVNIEERAFDGSDIRNIVIPQAVRCVGEYAFSNCKKLKNVDIYLSRDVSQQPILDFGVFANCPSLTSIHLYYETPRFASYSTRSRDSLYSTNIDLSVKLTDLDIRENYGIATGATPAVEVIIVNDMPAFAAAQPLFRPFNPCEDVYTSDAAGIEQSGPAGYISVDVVKFISALKNGKQLYNDTWSGVQGTFAVSDGCVRSYSGEEGSQTGGTLDFNDRRLRSAHSVAPSAFYKNADICEIIIDDRVSSIGDYAFYGCKKPLDLVISRKINDFSSLSIGHEAFGKCRFNNISILSENDSPARLSCCFPNVKNLDIACNSVFNVVLSAEHVKNLSISADYFAAGSLTGIDKLDNVSVKSAGHAVFENNIFSNGEIRHIKKLLIDGEFTLMPYSLRCISVGNDLELDVSNSYVYRNAFDGSYFNNMRFFNFDRAKSAYGTNLTAFGKRAFQNSNFDGLYLDGIDAFAVSSMFLNERFGNATALPENVAINDCIAMVGDSMLPPPKSDMLCIDMDLDGKYVVLCCNWNHIGDIYTKQSLYDQITSAQQQIAYYQEQIDSGKLDEETKRAYQENIVSLRGVIAQAEADLEAYVDIDVHEIEKIEVPERTDAIGVSALNRCVTAQDLAGGRQLILDLLDPASRLSALVQSSAQISGLIRNNSEILPIIAAEEDLKWMLNSSVSLSGMLYSNSDIKSLMRVDISLSSFVRAESNLYRIVVDNGILFEDNVLRNDILTKLSRYSQYRRFLFQNLQRVVLPKTLTEIRGKSFNLCERLSCVYFKPGMLLEKMEDNTFGGNVSLTELTF